MGGAQFTLGRRCREDLAGAVADGFGLGKGGGKGGPGGVGEDALGVLRHVAATLTHGAGGDLHTIKETLRHSTITLTSDTYTSLLPEVDRATAEAVTALVPRARVSVPEEN